MRIYFLLYAQADMNEMSKISPITLRNFAYLVADMRVRYCSLGPFAAPRAPHTRKICHARRPYHETCGSHRQPAVIINRCEIVGISISRPSIEGFRERRRHPTSQRHSPFQNNTPKNVDYSETADRPAHRNHPSAPLKVSQTASLNQISNRFSNFVRFSQPSCRTTTTSSRRTPPTSGS